MYFVAMTLQDIRERDDIFNVLGNEQKLKPTITGRPNIKGSLKVGNQAEVKDTN